MSLHIKKTKTNSLIEEEEGNALSRFFGVPIDSPMENERYKEEKGVFLWATVVLPWESPYLNVGTEMSTEKSFPPTLPT